MDTAQMICKKHLQQEAFVLWVFELLEEHLHLCQVLLCMWARQAGGDGDARCCRLSQLCRKQARACARS